jgi:glutamate dehydrogenase
VPELAVMIAYTKNIDVAEILKTDLPDQPALVEDLIGYFPAPLRERFEPQIRQHRLRREIAATQLVNQMVNLSGISYDHRMTEDTGASVSDVARAWLVAREVLDFPAWWREIGELDSATVTLDDRLALFLDCRRTAERCSLWFLRHRRPPVDIDVEVARFREPVQELARVMAGCMSGPMADGTARSDAARRASGVPAELATRSSIWRLLHTAFDIVEVAERCGATLETAATAYWAVFERLELIWLWDGIGALPRSDRWQTQARSALRDDLLTVLAGLAHNVVEQGDRTVGSWMHVNERAIERAMTQLTEIRRADAYDITNLSVAIRQLRNLVSTSVRGA